MVRRAEWRSLPNDPKTLGGLLRAWARDLWTLTPFGEVVPPLLFLAVGALFLLSTVEFAVSSPLALFSVFAVLLATSTIVVALKGTRALLRRFDRCPKPSLPEPLSSAPDAFPVRFSIRRRGVLTGLDEGVAAFVDGWLYVEGRRTDFAIRAEDGRCEWRDGVLRIGFPNGQRLDLCLQDPPKGTGAYFHHAASLWIADRERPEGESILPPLAIQPTVRVGRAFTWLLGSPLGLLAPFALAWSGTLALLLAALGLGCLARGVSILATPKVDGLPSEILSRRETRSV